MTDLLAQGAQWLDDQRQTHLTRTVVYRRGADEVQLSATVGRTLFEQADEVGLIQRLESRDYLVRTADLVLAGTPTLPAAGDLIRETDAGGTTFVYEVLAPGTEPPWRYSDPYRLALRVHSKHVATESP